MKRLQKLLTNFYFLTTLLFLVWLSFFDGNDFYSQYLLHQKSQQLEAEKAFYKENIQFLSQQKQQFEHDEAVLEKLARQNYQMHRPDEEVFVVE